MTAGWITTDHLDLVPASTAALRAALESKPALGASLAAAPSPGWPPEYTDAAALQFTLDRLTHHPEEAGWWMYFVLLRPPQQRLLIGVAGYKGPPGRGSNGTVEIGYGIVHEQRRRGYATEAARALVAHAFTFPAVGRIVAETLPELVPSIGVLRKCGFQYLGAGSEPGVIRYELWRRDWALQPQPPRRV